MQKKAKQYSTEEKTKVVVEVIKGNGMDLPIYGIDNNMLLF
jgi:hypothetical protein